MLIVSSFSKTLYNVKIYFLQISKPRNEKNVFVFTNLKTSSPNNYKTPKVYGKGSLIFNVLTGVFKQNTYWFLSLNNQLIKTNKFASKNYQLTSSLKYYFSLFLSFFKKTLGDGFLYIRGLFLIFFIDACLTDDEPI